MIYKKTFLALSAFLQNFCRTQRDGSLRHCDAHKSFSCAICEENERESILSCPGEMVILTAMPFVPSRLVETIGYLTGFKSVRHRLWKKVGQKSRVTKDARGEWLTV